MKYINKEKNTQFTKDNLNVIITDKDSSTVQIGQWATYTGRSQPVVQFFRMLDWCMSVIEDLLAVALINRSFCQISKKTTITITMK